QFDSDRRLTSVVVRRLTAASPLPGLMHDLGRARTTEPRRPRDFKNVRCERRRHLIWANVVQLAILIESRHGDHTRPSTTSVCKPIHKLSGEATTVWRCVGGGSTTG